MNYRSFFLSSILIIVSCITFSQTIVTIAGEKVPVDDFVSLYNKNNGIGNDVTSKVTPNEYMNLFVNFKLKVKEAEAMGLDKDPAFIKELDGYREQLAKPYLVDEETTNMLIKEAYDNMQYDLRASHILVNLPEYAIGEDTLSAWNKIMDIRKRALAGEDFAELAYKLSDDPSARERETQGRQYPANKGDLGFFSAFDMIYPFEHVAFKLEVGEISMPVRTQFGYHLIYLTDKRPAIGECSASHIILRVPNKTAEDTAKVLNKANQIYARLMAGEDFATVATETTEDPSTAKTGGKLPNFTVSRIEPNFIEQIFNLKNIGDISKPFFSAYGCHIVKLEGKQGIGSFEQELDGIKRKIAQSDRAKVQVEVLTAKLKKDYNFKENVANVNELLPEIEKNATKLSNIEVKNNKLLFSFNKQDYYQKDFIEYFTEEYKNKNFKYSEAEVKKSYSAFVNKELIALENKNLEKKYPEFRLLMQEYHDGILLFNVNDQLVWSAAAKDTTGLMNFYEQNKSQYQWKERAKATIFTCADAEVAKKALKLAKKGMDDKELVKSINTNQPTFQITMENKTFEVGDSEVLSAVNWEVGLSKIVKVGGKNYFVLFYEILPPAQKSFEECRGLVTSDYQSQLEAQWLKELKAKYPVEINYTELKKIY
ncbi:MAG: peptidylprolyl isomerase [Bacteroidales bacterium]|nr:peptidylprolyl isomerase [Bacteroidales bacterium]MDD2205191.1 peptidylprolyl isomerase [Bacteroidales bacterium]MDD3152373.1 peptidylprolyl isomerase [Bacteroidales bacterium]MDD3914642.1 peptidylprolyl isomerase [Bacteroidales bacterium]MDD4634511.1 peptidylprolyl isomerase [Bacteroidales bacterium]